MCKIKYFFSKNVCFFTYILPLILILFGMDYVWDPNVWDAFRMGKIRFLFLAVTPYLFIELKKLSHWSISLFVSWVWVLWILHNYIVYMDITEKDGYVTVFQSDSIFMPLCLICAVIFSGKICKLQSAIVAKWLCYLGLAEAIHAWAQIFGFKPIIAVAEPWFQNMPIGMQGQQTIYGPLMVSFLAPALWTKRYWVAVIMLPTIILTGSSMTFISLGCLLFIFSQKFLKTYVSLSILACMALFWLLLPHHNHGVFNTNFRAPIWIEGLKHISVLGGGPNYWAGALSFRPEIRALTFGGLRPERLHAEWLEVLVDFGVVGFIIFLGGLVAFFKSFKNTWHHALVCAILVNALANFPLHIVSISVIFLIALIYSLQQPKELI